MRKIISVLILFVTIFTFTFSTPALAADGKAVFTANCNACHTGGGNTVNPAKTLSKADLEKNDMYSQEAIISQITNGKNAMPAFKGRLNEDEIASVAAYVMEQAEAGW